MINRLGAAVLAGGLGPMVALTAQQQPPYVERVEVARVLIDARVVDSRGQPLHGLSPSDFSVRIGGREVRVETAEWVGGAPVRPDGTPQGQQRAHGIDAAEIPPRRGRLVVFLVQRSLEPSRMVGLMQSAQLIDTLLRPLTSDDRAAVLSFDSRLRIWTDFTNDLARVRTLLAREVINGRAGPVEPGRDVSLMTHLTPARAERTHGIEHALRHIGESLEPLPGAKSLVLLGYGFGRFDARSGRVLLMDGFDEASAALQRARVTVFALNVTRADHNSLQAGLESVAEETGGAYASTFRFPERALAWISQSLAGHYVLSVERPDLEPGVHRIDVRLTRERGRVTARSTWEAGARESGRYPRSTVSSSAANTPQCPGSQMCTRTPQGNSIEPARGWTIGSISVVWRQHKPRSQIQAPHAQTEVTEGSERTLLN